MHTRYQGPRRTLHPSPEMRNRREKKALPTLRCNTARLIILFERTATIMIAFDTNSTPAATALTVVDAHRKILSDKLAAGARAAGHLLETIERDAPKDAVVRAGALAFEADARGLLVGFGSERYTLSRFALAQVAERAGVPTPYLAGLLAAGDDDDSPEDASWRLELARHVLARHYAHDDGRVLVRAVQGQVRGWLSDRFRRLDCRPLFEALSHEARRLGAVPVDAVVTETRMALKVVIPEILEPVPGELVVLGGEWSNSDFGHGTHAFRAFLLRVACLNGAVADNPLRQVHLGAKLNDDLELSAQTYRLDTLTQASYLRDVVRGTLGPAGRDRLVRKIQKAHATSYSAGQLAAAVRKLPKKTAEAVSDAFASPDVVTLPRGETVWRASNAISWIARATEDAEARLDLERLAGAVL